MSRSQVTLRPAEPDDAPGLATLWADVLRRNDADAHEDDMAQVIALASDNPRERVLVAEIESELAGAVHLKVTTMTSLNLEPVVHALSPFVSPKFRRRGVGRVLMDAAVSFAEESGVAMLGAASVTASRDANRFLARLALSPQAILRVAPTQAVRAKLSAQRPGATRGHGRQLGQVLAARRSMRRS